MGAVAKAIACLCDAVDDLAQTYPPFRRFSRGRLKILILKHLRFKDAGMGLQITESKQLTRKILKNIDLARNLRNRSYCYQ